MIYELLYPLSLKYGWLRWLNVLRYVPFRAIMATITAMLMCFLMAPWFIETLKSKQIGQVIRRDGPDSHLSKAGTPTMGGSLILLAVLVPTVLWAEYKNAFVSAAAFVTVGYGAIGYLDDRLKIEGKNTRGLPGRYKMLGQLSIGGAAIGYLFLGSQMPPQWHAIKARLAVPFVAFDKLPIELPLWLYMLFALLTVVAMSNAVNLTDGLDGLAIGPVMINAGVYTIWAYIGGLVLFGRSVSEYLNIAGIQEMSEMAVFGAAIVGAGVGFLWYNTYPAQVFMGDVGALALGGGLGMMAVTTKTELLSILIGGLFFVETVSVMIQVTWFKLFKRRIFLMAPIHHHFEKKGWPEPKIIVRFWIISILLGLVGLASLKVR